MSLPWRWSTFVERLLGVVRNYREIENTIRREGKIFPKFKTRVLYWLLAESLTRKTCSRVRTKAGKLEPIPKSVQQEIDRCTGLCCGYLAVMAYDEGVEKYSLTKKQIYEQLSKCLLGFLVASRHEFPIPIHMLRSEISNWSMAAAEQYAGDGARQQEIMSLFEISESLSENCSERGELSIADLLYKTHDQEFDDLLNVTIIAAVAMGKTYMRLLDILQKNIDKETDLEWNKDFIFKSLIKSAYAQANTGKQRAAANLSWKDYIEIACGKSNSLIDIANCFRDIVDEQRFFRCRFNGARFCEQFMDDMQDFEEDTVRGIIGYLHLRVIEQGRLAEQLLPYWMRWGASPYLIPHLKDALAGSQILRTRFDGIFLYQNPVVQSRRNSEGEILFEVENIENILREIFVNSERDCALSLESLILFRLKLHKRFIDHWTEREYEACSEVVSESSIVPAAFASISQFLKQSRPTIIQVHREGNGSLNGEIYYLCGLLPFYWAVLHFYIQQGVRALRKEKGIFAKKQPLKRWINDS